MQYIDIDSTYRDRNEFPLQARFDLLMQQKHACLQNGKYYIKDPVSIQSIIYPNPQENNSVAFYQETLQAPYAIVEKLNLPYMYSTNTNTVVQLDELVLASTDPTTTNFIINDKYPRNSIPLGEADEYYTGDFLEDVTNGEFRLITSFAYDDTVDNIFQTAIVQTYITYISGETFITTDPTSPLQIPTSNVDRFYQGKFLKMISGNSTGEKRLIINYTITSSMQYTFQLDSSFGSVLSGDKFAIVSDRKWFATIESPFSNSLSPYPCFRTPLPTQTIWNPTILASESGIISSIRITKLTTPTIAIDYISENGESRGDELLGTLVHNVTTDSNGNFGIERLFTVNNVYNKVGFGLKLTVVPDGFESVFGPQLVYMTPNLDEAQWQSISWSPTLNLFAVVGKDTPSVDEFIIMTSSNGLNWDGQQTRDYLDLSNQGFFSDIIWHTNASFERFIAVQSTGATEFWYSLDGINWVDTQNGAEGYFSVTTDGTDAVALSLDRWAISTNGVAWTETLLPASVDDRIWSDVLWDATNSMFVAVASGDTTNSLSRAMKGTAAPGIVWSLPTTSPSMNQWNGIATDGAGLVVAVAGDSVGTNDKAATTTDGGDNWVMRVTPNNNWTSVTYSSTLTLFVAVANSGVGNRVMTSTNGIEWISRSSAADNDWTSVEWSPELSLFVAVAETGDGDRVMTSSDGISWVLQSSLTTNDWYLTTIRSLDPSGRNNWQRPLEASPEFFSPDDHLIVQNLQSVNSTFSSTTELGASYSYFNPSSTEPYEIIYQYLLRQDFGPREIIASSLDELRLVKTIALGPQNTLQNSFEEGIILYYVNVDGESATSVSFAMDISTGTVGSLSSVTLAATDVVENGWNGDMVLILNDSNVLVPALVVLKYGTGTEHLYIIMNVDGDSIVTSIEPFPSLPFLTKARLVQTTIGGILRMILIAVDDTEKLVFSISSTQTGSSVSDWGPFFQLDNSDIQDLQIINSNDDSPLIIYSRITSEGTNELVSLKLTEFSIQECVQYRIRGSPPLLFGSSTNNPLVDLSDFTVTLPSNIASTRDDIYSCQYIHVYNDSTYYVNSNYTIFNDFRFITNYDASTFTLTVDQKFTTPPPFPFAPSSAALLLYIQNSLNIGEDFSGNNYDFTINTNTSFVNSLTDINGVTINNIMFVNNLSDNGLQRDISLDTEIQLVFSNVISGALNLSISTWFNSVEFGISRDQILSFRGPSDFILIYLSQISGINYLIIEIIDGGTTLIEILIPSIVFNTWYNFAFVLNGNGSTVYLNGENVTNNLGVQFLIGLPTTTVPALTIEDCYVGYNGPTLSSFVLNGYIKDVILTSDTWSTQEINDNILHGLGITNDLRWEILGNVFDHYVPLNYFGDPFPSQMRCMEIELTHLTLPNVVLKTGFGNRIAFYPYVYVEFSNLNDELNPHIYSNNPTARKAVFKVPIRDTSTPDRAFFVNNFSGMRQKIKFNPKDNFIFSIYLNNGELFETSQSDTSPPLPPDPLLQLSATVGFKII